METPSPSLASVPCPCLPHFIQQYPHCKFLLSVYQLKKHHLNVSLQFGPSPVHRSAQVVQRLSQCEALASPSKGDTCKAKVLLVVWPVSLSDQLLKSSFIQQQLVAWTAGDMNQWLYISLQFSFRVFRDLKQKQWIYLLQSTMFLCVNLISSSTKM